MQHKTLDNLGCPLARSLDQMGEWWSILILREAFMGIRRFDDFQTRLGIAPNILTRRLKALVDGGVLERRPYQDRPQRFEYCLTAKGRDFQSVILALVAWGNRWLAPEGVAVQPVDRRTGEEVEPVLIDGRTGNRLGWGDVRIMPGPAAGEALRRHLCPPPPRSTRQETSS